MRILHTSQISQERQCLFEIRLKGLTLLIIVIDNFFLFYTLLVRICIMNAATLVIACGNRNTLLQAMKCLIVFL